MGLIQRRALFWSIETASSVALLGLLLNLSMSEFREPSTLASWLGAAKMIALFFMIGSGYVLTSALSGLSCLRNGSVFRYPSISAFLYFFHLLFFLRFSELTSPVLDPMYFGGTVSVFICTLIGNAGLRKCTVPVHLPNGSPSSSAEE